MSVEDGAKLYDVCPHVSDSVRCHQLLSPQVPPHHTEQLLKFITDSAGISLLSDISFITHLMSHASLFCVMLCIY